MAESRELEIGFGLFVLVLVILFWGEPDLHDALIQLISGGCK